MSQAAGVNVATLHLHWQNKATLYEAVCRRHASYLTAFLEQAQREDAGSDLSPADRVGRLVDHIFDLLAERPAVAPMALESFSGQAPANLPTLFQHDIAVFRLVAAEIAKLIPQGRDTDPMLVLLGAFYFAIATFSDSPLQQALRGDSVYRSEELRDRIKKFGRLALSELLAPEAERPE